MDRNQKTSQYKALDYSFFYYICLFKPFVNCLRHGGAIFPHKKKYS